MKIYFKTSEEVICFCENLFKHYKQLDLLWHKDEKYGNKLSFVKVERRARLNEAIAIALAKVFCQYYLSKSMEKILRKTYYYSDQVEINRILQHAYTFVYEHSSNQLNHELKKTLKRKFVDLVETEELIHLQSIFHFQLKEFEKELIDLVGLGIDEYKQEEEYQEFINNIRVFLKRKRARLKELHILHDKALFFFKETGEQIHDHELGKFLQKEPLYLIGLSPTDLSLAPIISLAPKKIVIYSSNPFDGMIKTILNVCEERVTLKSPSHFPFTHSGLKDLHKK